MLKNFIGGLMSVDDAVAKAKAELGAPTAIIFGSPYDTFREYSQKLKEAFPATEMIGTTVSGFSDETCVTEGMFLMAMDETIIAEAGCMKQISTIPLLYTPELEKKVKKVSPGRDNTVCFELCTAAGEQTVSTLNVVLEKAGVPLFGGITAGTPEGEEKLVSCNGKVYSDACAYIILKNTHGCIRMIRENIYKPRKEKYVITKVTPDHSTIVELNNRRAVDVYAEVLNATKSELNDKIITNPFCRVVGDKEYLCAIFSFNEDGSITAYKKVYENDIFQITDIMPDYREVTEQTLQKATQELKSVSAIMTINCLFRFIYFQNLEYVNPYAKMVAGFGPHFGMVAEGEEFISQHINQSMVGAIFE